MKRALGSIVIACALLWLAAGALAAGSTGRLAYVTETTKGPPKVVIANAGGGQPRTLRTGDVPALSPNGRSVAFDAQSGAAALVIYSPAGALTSKYFKPNQVSIGPLAWSPDSRYLAAGMTDVNTVNKVGRSGVAIIDTKTGKVTVVAHGSVAGVSWAPTGDTVVFGLSKSVAFSSPVNLYTATPGSTTLHQLTTNGHSEGPVWGKLGIAYDHWSSRGKDQAPAFQIYLLEGSHSTQITHTHPGPLVSGLAPVAVSADGTRLIADFVGTDTSIAYTVNLKTHAAQTVKVTGVGLQEVTPWGISRNGQRLLVDVGGFEQNASAGKVESVPYAGGAGTVLASGDDPSWNQ